MKHLILLLLLLLTLKPGEASILAVIDKTDESALKGVTSAELDYLLQRVRMEVSNVLAGRVNVMTDESMAAIVEDMGIDLANCEGNCEVEVARGIGADYLISSSLVRLSSSFRLQLNLFETATATVQSGREISGKNFETLSDRIGKPAGELAALVVTLAGSGGAGGQPATLGGGNTDWHFDTTVGHIVRFESDPSGASLSIDGMYQGETPLSRELQPGPHGLEFNLQRYDALVKSITVDRKETISVTLSPTFGWLTVTSTPSGQPVTLDGNAIASTPVRDKILGPGAHTVMVGDETRLYPEGERFHLAKGEHKSIALNLSYKEGGLVLNVEDENGNALALPVYIDGKDSGESPLRQKLVVGRHKVRVAGREESLQISEKQTTTKNWKLASAELGRSFASGGRSGPLPGMTFVTIPSGSFTMGSPSSETGRDSDEGPTHRVTLSSFQLMTTEVTQAQWKAVMGANPSSFKGDDLPVESVSWNDVQDFIQKLNRQDPGKGYRLPTEAEWEYACRAGSSGAYCFGSGRGSLGDYAWYKVNSSMKTHAVAQKKANAWGLFDMHGNVWEWCQDWYGKYGSGSQTNPQGPSGGSYRVGRGGSWVYSSEFLRSAGRYYGSPGYRDGDLGFRLSRTL